MHFDMRQYSRRYSLVYLIMSMQFIFVKGLDHHGRCLQFCLSLPNATRPMQPSNNLFTVAFMVDTCSAVMNFARCAAYCSNERSEEAVVDTMEDRWVHCSNAPEVLRNQECFHRARDHMSSCYRSSCKKYLKHRIKDWADTRDAEKTVQLESACRYWQCSYDCLFAEENQECNAEGKELLSSYGKMAVHYWLKKLHIYAQGEGHATIDHLFGPQCCKVVAETNGWKKCTSTADSSTLRLSITLVSVTIYLLTRNTLPSLL